MRRPLFVSCITFLAMQAVAICLPQNLLLILAAIFSFCLLLVFLFKRHGYCICILIGIILGLVLFFANQQRNIAKVSPYFDKTVTLTAYVEDPYYSYIEDMIGATLHVYEVDGVATSFSCTISLLPDALEGEIIQGDFLISALTSETDQLSNYSNGIFAQAEYQGNFVSIGTAGGLRGFFIAAQEALSRIIRLPFSDDVGGVLAAMTVGDRDHLSDAITDVHRKAGLSHVLVVSGLHLSLVCSFVFIPQKSRRARIIKSILVLLIAFLLTGITGASSSILRAFLVLILYTIGNLIDEQADGFTSLGLAGVLLLLQNGYVICNLSFQLSFASTLGVLLGVAFIGQTLPYLQSTKVTAHRHFSLLYTSIIISIFASFATFPILVLWNMNISVLAFLSNTITFWMIPFILLFGFIGALVGLIPFLGWLSLIFLTSSAIFVSLLNKIATQIAALPGSQLYFETEYAVLVCLVVIALGTAAHLLKIKYRIAIPCLVAVCISGIAFGNYFMQDVIKVALLGTSSIPAIVVSQNDDAMVLFRGGEYNVQKIEEYLEKRGITNLALVVDLRMSPSAACSLDAEETIWVFDTPALETSSFTFGEVQGTIFNADGGGAVILDIGGTTLATTTGSIVLAEPYTVDVLLATASSSGSIVGEIALCKNNTYESLQSYLPETVYYGEDEVRLWLRYGGEYKLLGAQHGE